MACRAERRLRVSCPQGSKEIVLEPNVRWTDALSQLAEAFGLTATPVVKAGFPPVTIGDTRATVGDIFEPGPSRVILVSPTPAQIIERSSDPPASTEVAVEDAPHLQDISQDCLERILLALPVPALLHLLASCRHMRAAVRAACTAGFTFAAPVRIGTPLTQELVPVQSYTTRGVRIGNTLHDYHYEYELRGATLSLPRHAVRLPTGTLLVAQGFSSRKGGMQNLRALPSSADEEPFDFDYDFRRAHPSKLLKSQAPCALAAGAGVVCVLEGDEGYPVQLRDASTGEVVLRIRRELVGQAIGVACHGDELLVARQNENARTADGRWVPGNAVCTFSTRDGRELRSWSVEGQEDVVLRDFGLVTVAGACCVALLTTHYKTEGTWHMLICNRTTGEVLRRWEWPDPVTRPVSVCGDSAGILYATECDRRATRSCGIRALTTNGTPLAKMQLSSKCIGPRLSCDDQGRVYACSVEGFVLQLELELVRAEECERELTEKRSCFS